MQYIRVLMIVSQVLLVLFTAQWLHSQYISQREDLKKNLTKIFTDVQHQVSDSLLLSQVIDPATDLPADPQEKTPEEHTQPIALSPGGLHKILTRSGSISKSQEQALFSIDTIVFNEEFMSMMKHNGWDFNSQWINNHDSDKDGKNIFIKSDFFTQENGVLVKNYNGYLMLMLLPQVFFVFILLSITTAALFITYRSLRSQMKLSCLKDDFISNMSHELKTPIATVKIALEALNNYNVIDNPRVSREYLGMMTSEMDRLELLATRVLNTSLLESGNIYLQRERHDLEQLVSGVLQNMQPRFEKHGARISFETTGTEFLVSVDKLHMQGAIINLLDNSLKYATEPPYIHISLTEHNGAVQLILKDNGPGIPQEYKEKIFEKFFRVPTGNRHNTKGYGLGLSYAAQVMRQHNGSINMNNVATGGCAFTLTF